MMIGVLVSWVVIGWIMVRVGISVLWFSVCVLVSVWLVVVVCVFPIVLS